MSIRNFVVDSFCWALFPPAVAWLLVVELIPSLILLPFDVIDQLRNS